MPAAIATQFICPEIHTASSGGKAAAAEAAFVAALGERAAIATS